MISVQSGIFSGDGAKDRAISKMILNRADAFSFLNKFVTDSKPLLGFTLASWGFSFFVGSIEHLETEYLIINQYSGQKVLIPMTLYLTMVTTYQYGDMRELTGRIPPEVSRQPQLKSQLDYMSSIIEGALVLDFDGVLIGLIELNIEGLISPSV